MIAFNEGFCALGFRVAASPSERLASFSCFRGFRIPFDSSDESLAAGPINAADVSEADCTAHRQSCQRVLDFYVHSADKTAPHRAGTHGHVFVAYRHARISITRPGEDVQMKNTGMFIFVADN